MITEKISVIMPAYNSEKYVAEAIDSIIVQTYKNWELIAVDDGSTDRTGKIIDSYAAKDDRIKAVHTENKGVSHARNVGIDMAQGEWMVFLDSDDMYLKNALEALIRQSEGVDLVIGNYISYPEENRRLKIENDRTYRDFMELKSDFGKYLRMSIFSVVWGKLIRKSIIDEYFQEDYQYGEDTYFFTGLVKNITGIRFVADNIYTYRRINENSLSRRFFMNEMVVTKEIHKFYKEYFKDSDITLDMNIYYIYRIVSAIKALLNQPDIDSADRRKYVSLMVEDDYLKQIPLSQYPLTPFGQRIATLVKIGDVDLIMTELNRMNKHKKGC